MEWQRVVELFGGEKNRRGSGYLLASGLVLTARHVVEGLSSVDVRLLEPDSQGLPGNAGPWQPARVDWMSPIADLALLVPAPKSPSFRKLNSATTLARVDGRAPIRVHALGFPRAMLSPTHSDTLHLQATVNAWSGVRNESLLLDVGTTRPASDEGWKGMSGAAVFAGDRLVGVIEVVPGSLDVSTLRATPVTALFDDPSAGELLRAANVEHDKRPIDASYVDMLPRSGTWRETREQYARAVLTTFCSIDHLGLAVSGIPDGRTPALAAFTGRRLRLWSGKPAKPA